MSKHEKTFEKMARSPTPGDIKWSEVKGALEWLGYELLKNSGSRRKFVHKLSKDLIICHEPHPSPDVGKCTIDEIVQHLREAGRLKGKK
jgi:predicted RNA binding protein YcfA (HicA-like mRNA interferase family)